MTTADYALIISLSSALISVFSLAWNVWQKYLFVKPQVQVAFGVYHIFQRSGPDTMKAGQELLHLIATNMGPGPVIIHGILGRKRQWSWRWKRRFAWGYIAPIHGDPTSKTPVGIGPFGGGLPAKLDAAEAKSFYFPYKKDCFLKDGLNRIGIVDTYGRSRWCKRKAMRQAYADYKKSFLTPAVAGT